MLLYGASNTTEAPIDQFTVTVFVFRADGQLKARQVAPGRRELAVGQTKYSAMVLDVGAIEPTDTLMAGVDQAQRVGSDTWWRADLKALAESAARRRVRAELRQTSEVRSRLVTRLGPSGLKTRRHVRRGRHAGDVTCAAS